MYLNHIEQISESKSNYLISHAILSYFCYLTLDNKYNKLVDYYQTHGLNIVFDGAFKNLIYYIIGLSYFSLNQKKQVTKILITLENDQNEDYKYNQLILSDLIKGYSLHRHIERQFNKNLRVGNELLAYFRIYILKNHINDEEYHRLVNKLCSEDFSVNILN